MEPIELSGLNQSQLLIQAIATLNGLSLEVNALKSTVAGIGRLQDQEALECPFNPRRNPAENGQALLKRVDVLEAAVDQFRGAVGFVKFIGVATLAGIMLMIFVQVALQLGWANVK